MSMPDRQRSSMSTDPAGADHRAMNAIGAYYLIIVSDNERRAAARREALVRGSGPSVVARIAAFLATFGRPSRVNAQPA